MSKLYVFAIGGSGSRVLRSLTMLLSSGVHTNYEIVPMIVDPDQSNGDLVRTVDVMRSYENIHNALSFNNNEKNEFFKNPISALNDDGNYLLPLVGTSGISFENYLSLGTMSLENQAIMRMLFSNANLASDMNVGFKGNPNIGSIVLNQFTDSKDYNTFATNFVNGDKVFIISSIFGGTGASGFPLLLKNMRTNSNTALANAPMGAVSLLPYFNLKTDKKSSIQADSFITKAKAALNYYEKNVTGNNTLDDMYYLGDDFSAAGYDNCDGFPARETLFRQARSLQSPASKSCPQSSSSASHFFGFSFCFCAFSVFPALPLLRPLFLPSSALPKYASQSKDPGIF